MRLFIEKTMLLLMCILVISPLLGIEALISTSIIVYSLVLYLDVLTKKEHHLGILVLIAATLFFASDGMIFIPLLVYSGRQLDLRLGLLTFLAIIFAPQLPILIISLIAYYLAIRTYEHETLEFKSDLIQRTLETDKIRLRREQMQLQRDQIKNIEIATLQERNRIAHQLHDSIGHVISSSILQLEALQFITQESGVKDRLAHLSDLMQNGMTDIRHTLHMLYDDSFDLKLKVEQLIDGIQNAQVQFNYVINSHQEISLKIDILSIVQELIANFNKHSNATMLKLNILEQPAFYAITYHDNGRLNRKTFDGIGLLSMQETARKYDGTMTVNTETGFNIHIILMKETRNK